MQIRTTSRTLLADLTSPVSVYMRLRDRFSKCLLLEGTDYHGVDDSRSFICCDPMAELVIDQGISTVTMPGKDPVRREVSGADSFARTVREFLESFEIVSEGDDVGSVNGAFGFVSWDAVELMEDIRFSKERDPGVDIADAHLLVYRYVLAFNHFRNEMHVISNECDGHAGTMDVEELLHHAFEDRIARFPFKKVGAEQPRVSDETFLEMVRTCKKHIARGDVFQIVPSRRYSQEFEGDDFQVYRALRSINPSPYLFYCDFGSARLIGSSPEAQIVVKNREASIFPIAGTYPRSGNDEVDRLRAAKLLDDPKENAEHAMLVDLARNDLSRKCSNVHVAAFRDVQYFSHVIHLVSRVTGTLKPGVSALDVTAGSFPAGTLSGAPKHRAMQLIGEIEPMRRQFYGGAVGFFGFNGDAVLAIVIRSLLSSNNRLFYQAGMGVVHDSQPESELHEAHAKLGAVRAAINRAEGLTR